MLEQRPRPLDEKGLLEERPSANLDARSFFARGRMGMAKMTRPGYAPQ